MRCVGILLPSGALLEWRAQGDAVTLSDGDDTVELRGTFAEALQAWARGEGEPRRLQQLSRLHPWLAMLAKGARPLYAGDTESARAALGRRLAMLFIELTARCQERCVHCYADAAPERSEMLPAPLVVQLMEEAARLGARAVQFTGGDPLLHPALPALARRARDLGLDVEVFTNGLALSERLLDRLAPASPRLCFSLYATDAAVHDAITRVAGSFARTWRAIERARAAGLAVRIGIVAMRENEAKVPETVDALIAAGFAPEEIRIDFVRAVGRGCRVGPPQRLAIVPVASHRPMRGGKLCVAADRSVYLCPFARRHRLGRIGERSLAEMLRCAEPAPGTTAAGLACADCRVVAACLEG